MLLFAKIKVVPESPLCWVDLPSVQILQAPPSCPALSPDYRSSHICPWCCVWPKHHHCCLEQSRQFNISQISTASGSVYPTISIFHGGTINVMTQHSLQTNPGPMKLMRLLGAQSKICSNKFWEKFKKSWSSRFYEHFSRLWYLSLCLHFEWFLIWFWIFFYTRLLSTRAVKNYIKWVLCSIDEILI